MKAKPIKALKIKISYHTINDLGEIFLGWLFKNDDKTQHLIIDVHWLLEHEEDCDFGKIAKEAVDVLNDEIGDGWREVDLIYIESD